MVFVLAFHTNRLTLITITYCGSLTTPSFSLFGHSAIIHYQYLFFGWLFLVKRKQLKRRKIKGQVRQPQRKWKTCNLRDKNNALPATETKIRSHNWWSDVKNSVKWVALHLATPTVHCGPHGWWVLVARFPAFLLLPAISHSSASASRLLAKHLHAGSKLGEAL